MAFGDLKGTFVGNGASISSAIMQIVGSVSVAPQDLIVVMVAEIGANTVSAVTDIDILPSAYTAVNAGTLSTVAGRMFYKVATSGGTLLQVNCTATTSSNDWAGVAAVFEGPFTATPLDRAPANTIDAATPFTCAATTVLSQANELIVAGLALTRGQTATTATSPLLLAVNNASTTANTANSASAAIGRQVVAVTTSVTPVFASTGTINGAVQIVATFRRGSPLAAATIGGAGGIAVNSARQTDGAATVGGVGSVACGASVYVSRQEAAATFGGVGGRANYIRNPRAEGAIAGTPGTAPTFWTGWGPSLSLTETIVGTGVEDGISYIDVRISGTRTTSATETLSDHYFENATTVILDSSRAVSISLYAKLVSGSITNVNNVNIGWRNIRAGGSTIGNSSASRVPPNSTQSLSQQRFTFTGVPFSPAFYLQPYWSLNFITGTAIDITLRIGGAQIEAGNNASDLILPPVGSPGVTSRAIQIHEQVRAVARATVGGVGGVTVSATAVSIGAAAENPDLYTVLLVHADGMHGGVIFTDKSTYEHRLYPTAATVTTTYSKFGNGAISVAATSGAGIEVRNQIDFWFSTGQFTVEAWIYFPTAPSTSGKKAILANWGAGLASWWLGLENTTNKLTFYMSVDGTAQTVTLDYAVTWAAGTWYHVAVDRGGSNVVRLYLDGAVVASTTSAIDLFYTLAQNTRIGQDNDGSPFGSVIDEVRVSKGIARYAGAFTPRIEAFPNPTDETVELHIHMEGASGSTTFADFSKFKHSLTASGVSVVNVASVGSAVTGSLSNPTTSSKLIAGDPASFNLGSEPFTIEGWIYPTTAHVAGTTRRIMGQTGAGGFSWWIGLRADNILGFRWSIDGNPDATRELWSFYPDPIPVNTWTHFAMTRDAHGVFRFYCAGIIIHVPPGSGSASDVLYPSTAPFTIGASGDSGATDGLPGFYLDELRISKGIARYTNKHDAPGNPHPTVYAPFEDRETITALHIHADGTNGSTTIIDTSQFANTLTSVGGAQITTSNAKFGSGSLSLNGSTQYLSAGFENLDELYSERRLTIEAWVNFAVAPSTVGRYQSILSIWGENGDLSWWFGIDTAGGLIFLWGGNTGFYDPRWVVQGPLSPTLNTWYNVAVDKDIETVRLYVNGQVVSEFVYSEYDFFRPNRVTSAPIVGASVIGTTGTDFFQGLLDEIRYTRDRALYRGPYTPATEAFPDYGPPTPPPAYVRINGVGAVTVSATVVAGVGIIQGGLGDPALDSNTVLLLHMDRQSIDTTFFKDQSLSAHTITANNLAQATTATSKFGDGSLWVPFNNSSLSVTGSLSDFNFGSGRFTIEAWVYVTATLTGNAEPVFTKWQGTASNLGFYFALDNTGVHFYYSTTGTDVLSYDGAYTAPIETWVHLAVDFDGATLRLYANGTALSADAYSATIYPSTLTTLVGQDGATYPFHGYIDELRVSKGVARYAGTFTPQARAFRDTTTPALAIEQLPDTIYGRGDVVTDGTTQTASITINGEGGLQAFARLRQRAVATMGGVGGRTNFIRNPRAEGAVPGTPGTAPTYWTGWVSPDPMLGLTHAIVGTGYEDGIPYLDLRITGTPTNPSTTARRFFETDTGIPIPPGRTIWTFSFYLRLVGGTTANVNTINYGFVDLLSDSSIWSDQSDGAFPPDSSPLRGQRFVQSSNTYKDATYLQPFWNFRAGNNTTPIDITLRIGGPQFELADFSATDLILPPIGVPGVTQRAIQIREQVRAVAGTVITGLGNVAVDATRQAPAGVIQNASVTINGEGGLQAFARLGLSSATTINGVGTLLANALPGRPTASTIAGTGTVVVSAVVLARAATTIAGLATVSAAALPLRPAAAAIGGIGTLTVSAAVQTRAQATIAAQGSVAVDSTPLGLALASTRIDGQGTVTASARRITFAAITIAGQATVAVDSSALGLALGAATIAGQGGIAIDARRVTPAAIAITGQGTITATASVSQTATVTITGLGTVASDARRISPAAAAIAGQGTTTIDVTQRRIAAATIGGVGTVLAGALPSGFTGAGIAGQGAVTVSAVVRARAAVTIAGEGSVSGTLAGITATATVTGQGTVSVTAGAREFTATSIAGQGSVTADALPLRPAASVLAGQGTVTIDGRPMRAATATISGQGAVGVTAEVLRAAAGDTIIAGRGTVSVSANVVASTSARIDGKGIPGTIASLRQLVSAIITGSGDVDIDAGGEGFSGTEIAGQGDVAVNARVMASKSEIRVMMIA